jgi:Flp pilus assembly protein TadG
MIRRLLHDPTASSGVEFALVLPLLLILLFGIIDGGRFLWTYNRAEKAAQMGARMAVVTDYVAPGIGTSYLGTGGLTQGDLIPASQFGKITCTSTSCTCTTTPCPTVGTENATAFSDIVTRMKLFLPELTDSQVTIEYSSSGLGYAGNPYGPDIAPMVTVRITGFQFTPITTLTMATFTIPDIVTTLSAEDLTGSQSN